MKKVVVITTGGTIAMKRNSPMVGGAVPMLKGEDFLAQLPRSSVNIAFEEFTNLPSSHLTPAQALELGQRIEAALLPNDVDGVVVTHGTDTLEESAYLIDLTVHSTKPVVFTGAMRTATMVGYDGMLNLAAAIRVAAAEATRNQGTLVVFNEAIYAASEVQKVHSQAVNAFDAPGSGPLGRVEGERVLLHHQSPERQFIPCSRVEEMVDLIRIAQGADDRLLRHSIADGVAGIVLETFGSGRVPPWWLPTIGEALSHRIAVVVATRCGAGSLYDEYGYVGAFHDLQRLGVLFAHNLSGLKARIKLMVALGTARKPSELRAWFL
ncbi:MAG TPA: asparaginase [Roseiflexaceae bacterium]|nr:asparaginase [Roseiflexaceae bacterium]